MISGSSVDLADVQTFTEANILESWDQLCVCDARHYFPHNTCFQSSNLSIYQYLSWVNITISGDLLVLMVKVGMVERNHLNGLFRPQLGQGKKITWYLTQKSLWCLFNVNDVYYYCLAFYIYPISSPLWFMYARTVGLLSASDSHSSLTSCWLQSSNTCYKDNTQTTIHTKQPRYQM